MRPKEVAQQLGITYSDVFYLVETGRLSAVRFGRNGRFLDIAPELVNEELQRRIRRLDRICKPPNPTSLCMCGCGRPAPIAKRNQYTRGTRAGCPLRYLPGHHPNGWQLSDVRYAVDTETGCWVWQRSTGIDGYPKRMKVDCKSYSPHRYYYEQKYGKIPEGYALDHLCKNRLCVNPDHQQPVTQTENTRRSSIAKLTEKDAANIKALFTQGYSKRRLGRMFGVTHTTIADLLNGVTWKDIEPTK